MEIKSGAYTGIEPENSMTEKSDNSRRADIEFLRVIAAFLVIVNHTNSGIFLSLTPCKTWVASLTYFYICKIAVPVFLLIMGALLLKRQDSPKKSVGRVCRFVVVIVAASAVYYFLNRNNWMWSRVPDFFTTIISKNITNAFWYLYLYVGLLCLLPIMQRMAASFTKNELRLFLLLSLGVMGTVPILRLFHVLDLNPDFTAAFFSPYIGMVMAGYYLERYVVMTRKKFYAACFLFVFLIVFQVAGTWGLYQSDPALCLALDDITFITITGSAICFYLMVKYLFSVIRLTERARRAICYMGGLTFGNYLVSDLMIYYTSTVYDVYDVLLRQIHLHIFLAMILWEIVIFLSGMLVTAVLKKLPVFRRWL